MDSYSLLASKLTLCIGTIPGWTASISWQWTAPVQAWRQWEIIDWWTVRKSVRNGVGIGNVPLRLWRDWDGEWNWSMRESPIFRRSMLNPSSRYWLPFSALKKCVWIFDLVWRGRRDALWCWIWEREPLSEVVLKWSESGTIYFCSWKNHQGFGSGDALGFFCRVRPI